MLAVGTNVRTLTKSLQTPLLASVRTLSTATAPCSARTGRKVDRSTLPPVRWAYSPYPVPYELGLKMQEHLVESRADARAVLRSVDPESDAGREAQLRAQTDTLLLLQHTPVYTEGRRGGQYAQTPEEVVELTKRFNEIGADYQQTLRGGLITFHGPGQLVGYPILDLGAMGVSTKCYVDYLQRIFRQVLAERKLKTVDPPEDHTGVWTDEQHKITSIGIRVRHRITSHGFAFNVEQEILNWFGYIVACGIQGKGMTCLQRQIILRNNAKRPPTITPEPRGPLDALPGTSPFVGNVEPPLPLDAEAAAVTVRSVVPDFLQQFASVFDRSVEPEPTPDLVFVPNDKGVLGKAIVDGHVIE